MRTYVLTKTDEKWIWIVWVLPVFLILDRYSNNLSGFPKKLVILHKGLICGTKNIRAKFSCRTLSPCLEFFHRHLSFYNKKELTLNHRIFVLKPRVCTSERSQDRESCTVSRDRVYGLACARWSFSSSDFIFSASTNASALFTVQTHLKDYTQSFFVDVPCCWLFLDFSRRKRKSQSWSLYLVSRKAFFCCPVWRYLRAD